jgi:uncharacterized repeat protein (TIGR01451 family)
VTAGSRTPTASAQAGCTLTIEKTAVPDDFVSEGGSIEYTLVVENTGATGCTSVIVTDELDEDAYCVDTTETGGFATADCVDDDETDAGATITWTVGTLAAHATATLTLTAQLTPGAVDGEFIDNTAAAAAAVGSVGGSDALSIEVVNDCDLDIEKVADNTSVQPGDEITYTITVTNLADENGAGCTDVSVEDDLTDVDAECVDASVNDRDHLHFDQDAIDNSCDDNDVVWAAADGDVLPGGDSVELELTVVTDDSLEDGDSVRNEVCVFGVANEDITAPAEMEVCSTERTKIVEPTPTPTSTSTPTRTPTPFFTPFCPPCAGPTSGPMATVQPPSTGDGPDGSGTNWFAIGMSVGVLSLLVAFSAVLARKKIRIRR